MDRHLDAISQLIGSQHVLMFAIDSFITASGFGLVCTFKKLTTKCIE